MKTIFQCGLPFIKKAIFNEGLRFQTGPFTLLVRSRIKAIPKHIFNLYPDNELINDKTFTDYHININRSKGLRYWIKPQVIFSLDGFKPFTPLPFNQATAQFEWGLNWCIASQAHQYLIIHSAVVEKKGITLILPGSPGNGKSTLCAGLVQNGWRLLSDEMALISLLDHTIQPVPRPISLKNSSIDIIRKYGAKFYFGKIVTGTTKGDISHLRVPTSSVLQQHQTAIPKFIIFPKYGAESKTELTAMPKAEACMLLIQNTFNFNIIGEQGFNSITRLIDRSKCYSFTYPDLDQAVLQIESLIEE